MNEKNDQTWLCWKTEPDGSLGGGGVMTQFLGPGSPVFMTGPSPPFILSLAT